MQINKPLILEYAESVAYADRVGDPVVYHYLRKRMDGIYVHLTPEDIDYMKALLDESKKTNELAQYHYVIDKLKKEKQYMDSIFETKEQYVAFITEWKQIHKTLRHAKIVGSVAYNYVDGKQVKSHIMKSALSTSYHLVYLMATGKIDSAIQTLNPDTRAIISGSGFFNSALEDFKTVLTPVQKQEILQRIYAWIESPHLKYWG